MSDTRLVPLWRDPLFSPGDRFPLGPSRGIMEDCQDEPSGPATRPFSLRYVVAGDRIDTAPTLDWTYCHERQIALVYDEDGSLTPWAGAHTKPGATAQETSNGRADGQQPGGAEEMTAPDHQTD
jgi:putative ATP-grasp target RiPP